ncbi:MAG: hypothetical protein LCH77_06495 [Actinobacteria bacterium]|nr:hypothetical protein [Actinomycetota bacterium]
MSAAGAVSRRIVEFLTFALPSGPARNRYRVEFLGELDAMPPGQRAAYLLRLAARMPALAFAVNAPRRVLLGPDMPIYPSLRCKVHLGHSWSDAYTEDGYRYLRCRNCGTDRRGSSPAPDSALWVGNVAGPGMGGMS